jgi:stearoyl-CoA desaturase (delta-9 desaturase)
MLMMDLALFGAIGLTVWAVQMAWIPWWATGIINGIGHYWGYRNFEAPMRRPMSRPGASSSAAKSCTTTTTPIPTSAKFSVKPYEFDIGWLYIRLMQQAGPGQGAQDPAAPGAGRVKAVADGKTLEALIANRYEVMARYAELLQLDFLVQHVLARLGVELHEFELLGRGLLVLAGGVEVAGARGGLQLDLFASAFAGHGVLL